jgi:hypothetical protein
MKAPSKVKTHSAPKKLVAVVEASATPMCIVPCRKLTMFSIVGMFPMFVITMRTAKSSVNMCQHQ